MDVFQKVALIVFMSGLMLKVGLLTTTRALGQCTTYLKTMGRALVVNLVLVPLVAFAAVKLIAPARDASIALLLVAAAPGASLTPALVRLARGYVPFAVVHTFILGLFTVITAPILAAWSVPFMLDAQTPVSTVIAQLFVVQVVPLGLGLCIRATCGTFAVRLVRPVTLLYTFAMGALMTSVLLPSLRALASLDWRAFATIFSVAVVSWGLGWIFGGPTDATRRTLAVSANARNLAMSLLVAMRVSPNDRINATIVAVWAVLVLADVVFARAIVRVPRAGGESGPPRARCSARSVA
jgi:BASS family bile acid:Na+ symporter